MRIAAASFAYPNCDETVRARLSEQLGRPKSVPGSFVLSTCLRIEVAVEGGADHLSRAVSAIFGDASVLGAAAVRQDLDAVSHLFRVAAGLESPVLGEMEILTQFRHALKVSEARGDVGGLFSKLLETAVSVGRQAREMLPGSPHSSLAAVTAQVVGTAEEVAVFGSGIMANSVITGLLSLPAPPRVTVVARSPEKVAIAGMEVWGFDRAIEAIERFGAVVSATSAKRRLIDGTTLDSVFSRRTTPLTLVDMAMPPDFDVPPHAAVKYVSIDDLARLAARRPRPHEADDFVAAHAADAHRRMTEHAAVGPVIAEMMRAADDLVERAVDRFATKLGNGEDHAVLRQAAHTVARSLLANPVSYLRSGGGPEQATEVLAAAFGIVDG